MRLDSVDAVERALAEARYLPDRGLATAVYLSLAMERPLLLEGEAGVGKTEVGDPERPLVRGMRAALTYVDVFASAHNLASLQEVSDTLKSV